MISLFNLFTTAHKTFNDLILGISNSHTLILSPSSTLLPLSFDHHKLIPVLGPSLFCLVTPCIFSFLIFPILTGVLLLLRGLCGSKSSLSPLGVHSHVILFIFMLFYTLSYFYMFTVYPPASRMWALKVLLFTVSSTRTGPGTQKALKKYELWSAHCSAALLRFPCWAIALTKINSKSWK